MREQAVPVVRVVQAARLVPPVRCGRPLVTTSMWQRDGWDAPENNLEVSVAGRSHHASLP